MSEEYFMYIPIRFYQDILDKLAEYGYKDEDYYYPASEPEAIYEDNRGNKILGYKPNNLNIQFDGYGSVVELGKNCVFLGENNINVCGINVCGRRVSGNNVHIKIGNNCYMENLRLDTFNDSEIIIGNNCSFTFSEHITLLPFTTISIGNDCMFSWNIHIRSNDGHSIIDVKTGKNISSTEEIERKRKVVIGNHVWVGYRAIILYNTEIGDGSIIGAGSLVKGKIPNNCTAAGVPARVIRRDVAWSREEGADAENCTCPKEYINMTRTDD